MRKLPPSMRDAPFVDNLGLKFPKIKSGYCLGKATVRNRLLNNYGTVHGGALFTMADACSGAAAFFALAENEIWLRWKLRSPAPASLSPRRWAPISSGKSIRQHRQRRNEL